MTEAYRARSVLVEFRDFVARGNVVDLAVGVIAGVAFGTVVTSLVDDIITPLIAAIVGKPDFSALGVTLNGTRIGVGNFLNAVIGFLLTMAGIFFLIIKPLALATARLAAGEGDGADGGPVARECPHCTSSIPARATRCMHCCADVPALA